MQLRSSHLGSILASALALACATEPVQSQLQAETIARRLESVWSLAFAPDGRLFLTERPGRIRVIRNDSLLAAPWAVLPAHESAAQGNESGLMGLAIDPQFASNSRVYFCYTESIDGAAP